MEEEQFCISAFWEGKWLIMEKKRSLSTQQVFEFMLKAMLLVLLTNHLLKNVFDVTLFSNLRPFW